MLAFSSVFVHLGPYDNVPRIARSAYVMATVHGQAKSTWCERCYARVPFVGTEVRCDVTCDDGVSSDKFLVHLLNKGSVKVRADPYEYYSCATRE